MSRPVLPPRAARALLRRVLPSDVCDDILGDLLEVFDRTVEERGPWRARLWYWREAIAFSSRFALERLGLTGASHRGRALPISVIDIKLGLRLLVKYPMLTLVGCVALAIGTGAAVGVSTLTHSFMNPTLDHPDADRIVTVVNVDLETSENEYRSLHDFLDWRDEIDAFELLAAFRSTGRNLGGDVGGGEPLRTAMIQAEAFDIWGVDPIMGRTLLPSDARPDAPRVAVIGHDVWTSRFFSDPEIVGRVVQIDEEPVTVVGVMPEGYSFPFMYQLWEPFRFNALDFPRRDGPPIRVVGLLRPEVSLESVQHQLEAIGARTASAHPDTHARLRPRVMPMLRQFASDSDVFAAYLIQVSLVFLLLVVCANVGLLILARTLARTGELAVRNAMGASRRRLIGQLFTETLVLSGVATGLGLLLADRGIAIFKSVAFSYTPFWMDLGLDAGDFAFAGGLAVMSAIVAGVIPGLRATGRGMARHLQRSGGGVVGGGFGLGSRALVVTQVFFSVCLLAAGVAIVRDVADFRPEKIDLAIGDYHMARLQLDPERSAEETGEAYRSRLEERMEQIRREVRRRLLAEPGVEAVTFASRAPFRDHGARFMEVDGTAEAAEAARKVVVRNTDVAPDFFDVFEASLVAGRGFFSTDADEGPAIVVTEAFARKLFPGDDPLGRRVRYVDRSGAPVTGDWYRIVGVVTDMWSIGEPLGERDPVVYHPLRHAEAGRIEVIARAPNVGDALPTRMREIALAVEPTLTVTGLLSMQDAFDEATAEIGAILGMVLGGFVAVLVLSLAGMYAMVSFTVKQRTREIGIRTALGGPRWIIARGLVSRVMTDVAIGIALAALLLSRMGEMEGMRFTHLWAVAGAVVLTALVTCLVPTVRGMTIRPMEALRAEG